LPNEEKRVPKSGGKFKRLQEKRHKLVGDDWRREGGSDMKRRQKRFSGEVASREKMYCELTEKKNVKGGPGGKKKKKRHQGHKKKKGASPCP